MRMNGLISLAIPQVTPVALPLENQRAGEFFQSHVLGFLTSSRGTYLFCLNWPLATIRIENLHGFLMSEFVASVTFATITFRGRWRFLRNSDLRLVGFNRHQSRSCQCRWVGNGVAHGVALCRLLLGADIVDQLLEVVSD